MKDSKKQILRNAGFAKQVDMIDVGLCPLCDKVVKDEDFRDALSRKEHSISGMCQMCQDSVFGK